MVRVEKRGRAKRSAGMTKGGDKRREREGEDKPGKGKRRRRQPDGAATRETTDAIHHVAFRICPFASFLLQISSSILPVLLWYTLSRLSSSPLSLLLSFPIREKKFRDKKCDMSEWIHRPSLLCGLHRELKYHILPRQPAINGRK